MRLARPLPPTPTPAMLSLSLGGTKPRPRTWRGTIVRAAAAPACDRNSLRGIALFLVINSSSLVRQKEYHEAHGTCSARPMPAVTLLHLSYDFRGDEPYQLPIWRRQSL